MRAAVKAERVDAVAREQQRAAGNRIAEPPRRTPPSAPAASQEAGPETSPRATEPAGNVQAPPRPAGPERITGPAPEVEVTEWPGFAAGPRPAGLESVAGARPAAEPVPAVGPRPGKPRHRAVARLVVLGLAVIVIGSLAAVAEKHFSRPPAARAAVRAQAAAWVAEQIRPQHP